MISKELKKTYTDIHNKTAFGKRGKIPSELKTFIKNKNPSSILDFGCGKGNLVNTLQERYSDITVHGYDPANPLFDITMPVVDMIVSTDVLEHVEPEHINNVISMLVHKGKFHFHLISCAPAKLILPDGRNAHLIQEGPTWWRDKFITHGYNILSEDFKEFEKYSKQLRKKIPVKNYCVTLQS